MPTVHVHEAPPRRQAPAPLTPRDAGGPSCAELDRTRSDCKPVAVVADDVDGGGKVGGVARELHGQPPLLRRRLGPEDCPNRLEERHLEETGVASGCR
eukprot:CAMPEP_0180092208 /NCGR_PEP_ID=MMETSP0985-20121206/24396_1 /TAXON_ID=483367 /ORGANISM="non described non described, Strain CCMP 2436" /LENGTH=97 /DNA_ID=CAMNT_0022027169 /DNA_START=301 /DNA_END=591 /DNA_ORIENTATION=+